MRDDPALNDRHSSRTVEELARLPPWAGDGARLDQALRNVLTNALTFRATGGRV